MNSVFSRNTAIVFLYPFQIFVLGQFSQVIDTPEPFFRCFALLNIRPVRGSRKPDFAIVPLNM
jgi:hypothetical protein